MFHHTFRQTSQLVNDGVVGQGEDDANSRMSLQFDEGENQVVPHQKGGAWLVEWYLMTSSYTK